MTSHAVESETCIRIRKWRIVIVSTLRTPNFRPVPTILRSLAIFDHDGPAIYLRLLDLIPGCGRGVLLFYDHCAIWNWLARVFAYEPIDDIWRVIDLDGWMNSVADVINKRPGVTKFFVFTPI